MALCERNLNGKEYWILVEAEFLANFIETYIFYQTNYIINRITRKSGKHYAQHIEPLGNYFDLIMSHLQYIT